MMARVKRPVMEAAGSRKPEAHSENALGAFATHLLLPIVHLAARYIAATH
jgi:hypothetical protein